MKNKCIICKKEIDSRAKKCRNCYSLFMKQSRLGKNNPCWRGGKSIGFCRDCGQKIHRSTQQNTQRCRKCYEKTKQGKGNPNWKGGKRRKRFYGFDESIYMEWRNEVLARDNYTCQVCKSRNNLNVHHIIPNRIDSSKILDINNAITLCEKCHEQTYFKETKFIFKFLGILKNKCKNS